jgi:GntR family transcriptional regulator
MGGPRPTSRHNPLPLYLQVEQDLRRLIESHEWGSGYRIPSEKELEDLYGASRITIRRALQDLAADGLLIREPGRGTFVREPTLTAEPRGVTSFTEEMIRLGLKADARTIDCGREAADALVADRLHLSEGDPVVVIRRLRVADEKPLGIQCARLPAQRFPELESVDLSGRSLYEYLRVQYGVIPTEADEMFRVGRIEGDDAQLLNVEAGACAFLVERLTFDQHGPFEFVESIMRGDRYRVHLGLRNLT